MPFCPRTGMKPDIIINSISFISRMTVGQPNETLHAKARALDPDAITGTVVPFTDHEPLLEESMRVLRNNGFHPHGKQDLCDGRTGQLIEASIFMGMP